MTMNAFRPDTTVNLAVGVASAQTTAVWGRGEVLSIIASTNCWILTGTNATAVVGTGLYVPANVPMEIQIGGDAFEIAAIRVTADGHLTISRV
jgi:hypothetical protein